MHLDPSPIFFAFLIHLNLLLFLFLFHFFSLFFSCSYFLSNPCFCRCLFIVIMNAGPYQYVDNDRTKQKLLKIELRRSHLLYVQQILPIDFIIWQLVPTMCFFHLVTYFVLCSCPITHTISSYFHVRRNRYRFIWIGILGFVDHSTR